MEFACCFSSAFPQLHNKRALTRVEGVNRVHNVDGRKGWLKELESVQIGWVIEQPGRPGGLTGPEKTDGSARGSWGLGLRKQRSHQGPWWCMRPRC